MSPCETPRDYEAPDWDASGGVHNWRNYVSLEVRQLWAGFSLEQRAALARQAQDLADREDWD